jgi:hypothetical protein
MKKCYAVGELMMDGWIQREREREMQRMCMRVRDYVM